VPPLHDPWTDEPARSIGFEMAGQLAEYVVPDNLRIRVQQEQMPSSGVLCESIVPRSETEVLPARQQPIDATSSTQSGHGIVFARVVEHVDLETDPGLALHGLDARQDRFGIVEGDDLDRYVHRHRRFQPGWRSDRRYRRTPGCGARVAGIMIPSLGSSSLGILEEALTSS
jgi:hypothetical protein